MQDTYRLGCIHAKEPELHSTRLAQDSGFEAISQKQAFIRQLGWVGLEIHDANVVTQHLDQYIKACRAALHSKFYWLPRTGQG